ncbi:MAG: DUF922 domain-containing protein [Sphingobacteriales bacterium]|nr:MAG: DUF922 domain-containing protein [Sphingobacteriales bacterium]
MNRAKTWTGMLALVCATLSPQFSSAHKIVTSDSENPSVAEKSVVVLQAADPVPFNAVKLNTVDLGASKSASSYRELLADAKLLAMKSDANIVKVMESKTRTGSDLKVTFYKAENPRAYEKEFGWTSSRKLVWDDFRGPVQHSMGHDVAAATFCGIGFETNTISAANPELKVVVYNTFYPTKSFVKTGLEKPEILAHEQCHFDICELYTRKLRAKMSKVKVSVETMKTTLRSLYKEVQQEYIQRQEMYEEETEHGIIGNEQARWEVMIAKELAATDNWKSQ